MEMCFSYFSLLRLPLHASRLLQVCFGVAVNISYELKQSVIYIDTSGGLTASRLLQMLKAKTSSTEQQVS